MELVTTFSLAFVGGLVPALVWLWFFLREDRDRPEPHLLILLAFLAGMLSVIVALVLESLSLNLPFVVHGTLATIILWAFIEEFVKWALAAVTVLWRPFDDEPIDPVIYMITVALGFSALETALFLLGPIFDADITNAIVTGNLRFLGAALVHVVSSAAIGFALGFAFYHRREVQYVALVIGIILATALHALFNFLIMTLQGPAAMYAFLFVWASIVGMLLAFERIKQVGTSLFASRT
ncbi:PrsW family intramembrane metalloprotease [Patescibacteria group bacterium]|jgi:RsiW-degrading membrane proteinase PrsW (M82 family)|nr:PrsW family intramembrane metalloprotease [Patescibacteria group bacterium]